MKIHPALRLCLPLAGALILLTGVLLCLPHGTQAAIPPTSESATVQTSITLEDPPVPPPDSRWLALARAAEPAPMKDGKAINQAEAAASINVDLLLGYVAGQVPLPTEVTLRLERQGEVLVTDSTMPIPEPGVYYYIFTGDSDWQVCDPSPYNCTTIFPIEGDLLRLEQSGAVFSMTVPHLTALASPEEDRVYGVTTPGASVNIYFYPEAEPGQVYTATAVASTDGYSASLLPVDVHRKDGGISQVETAPGRYAYRAFRAPLLGVQVGGNIIYGSAAPSTRVDITVTHPGNPDEILAWAQDYTDNQGFFSTIGYVGSSTQNLDEGFALRAKCAGQIFTMTVPHLSAAAELAAGTVKGEAIPGALLEVLHFDGPLSSTYSPWRDTPTTRLSLGAGPAGSYTVSLPLTSLDYGAVFTTMPDEHRAFAHFVIPNFMVSIGEPQSPYNYAYTPYYRAQLPVFNQPITVSVQGPSGFLKEQLQSYANHIGLTSLWPSSQNALVIDSGDLLTVTTPGFTPMHIPIPLFSATGDLETNRITGKAPPGAALWVIVQEYGYPGLYPDQDYYYYPREVISVTATTDGSYLADFTGIFTFTDSTQAAAILWTPAGHGLQRPVELPNSCLHGVTGARIGNSVVEFEPRYSCSEVYLRLLAPDGREKGNATIPGFLPEPNGVRLYDQQYQPALIQPGDRLEISFEGEVTFYEVPAITTWIDEGQAAITGSAPPGAQITAILKQGDLAFKLPDAVGTIITGTASAGGSYLLPVSDPKLLTAGLWAKVMLSGAKPAFYVLDVLPLIKTTLYASQIFGTIKPESAYTLTWQSADGEATFTGVSYWYGEYFEYMDNPRRIVSPGDQISLQTSGRSVSMTVPLLSAAVDLPSATVSGKAPPESPLAVGLDKWGYYHPENPYTTQIVTATTSGDFSAAFPDLAPLTRAQGSLTYHNPQGHVTEFDYASPYLEVIIDEECIAGSVPAVRQQYALTHKPLSGPTQVVTGTAYVESGAFSTCLSQAVQPGDQLTLESPVGSTTMIYAVPQLTARHDYAIQAVTGSAPPQAELQVRLTPSYTTVTRRAISRPDGIYGVDTSDLNLRLRDFGMVTYYDPVGAIVRRYFFVTGYQRFFPILLR